MTTVFGAMRPRPHRDNMSCTCTCSSQVGTLPSCGTASARTPSAKPSQQWTLVNPRTGTSGESNAFRAAVLAATAATYWALDTVSRPRAGVVLSLTAPMLAVECSISWPSLSGSASSSPVSVPLRCSFLASRCRSIMGSRRPPRSRPNTHRPSPCRKRSTWVNKAITAQPHNLGARPHLSQQAHKLGQMWPLGHISNERQVPVRQPHRVTR